jgi:hypothetical protein
VLLNQFPLLDLPKTLITSLVFLHRVYPITSGIRIGHLVDMFNQLDALPREALRNALPYKALRPRVSVAYFTLRSPGSKTIPQGVNTYKIPTIVIND